VTWLGGTDTYSLYYTNGTLTIFDKRLNDHMPVTLHDKDAEEFLKVYRTIPLSLYNKEIGVTIDELCEQAKKDEYRR